MGGTSFRKNRKSLCRGKRDFMFILSLVPVGRASARYIHSHGI